MSTMSRLRAILTTTCVALTTLAFSAASAEPPSKIDYDRSGTTPIIRYQEIIAELSDSDPGPSVEVYGDGRVVVRIPAYMRRSGTHVTELDANELEKLVADIAASGAVDFDAEAADAARTEVRAKRALARRGAVGPAPEIHSATDPTTTVIETRLTPDSRRREHAPRVARWAGLRNDAELYPEVKELRELAVAEQRLRALMRRNDLRPQP